MDIDIRSLRQIMVLAAQGSISRAARELGLSQPALSRAISGLEDSLGVRLFDRLARGVRPTSIGRLIVARGEGLLRELGDLQDEIEQRRDLHRGDVALGLGPVQAHLLLRPALRGFLARHRDIHVHLRVDAETQLRQALRDEEIELYVSHVVGDVPPDLVAIALTPQEMVLVGSAGHPLAKAERVVWDDTVPFPLVVSAGRSPSPRAWAPWRDLASRQQLVVCNDGRIGIDLAQSGDALAIMPLAAVREAVDAGHLAVLRFEAHLPRLLPMAIRHRDRALSGAAECLLELLIEADRNVVAGEPPAA